MPNKNIIWLASYPKSGNTWFRVFLSNLLSEDDKPVSINELQSTPIASSRVIFEEYSGVTGSDLSQEEIDDLRPGVYREIAENADDLVFHKVHDAWKLNRKGEPLFPEDVTRAVIYFIRDPRDVAVSFAHHSSLEPNKMVKNMGQENFAFCEKPIKLYNQLKQDLSTWSGHVKSWVDRSGLPLLVLRYEDMKEDTFREFNRAVNFIGLTHSKEKIKLAIRNSEFARLKKMEEEEGFAEKPMKMGAFFRKGSSGSWRDVLSKEDIRQLKEDHGEVMERFGYLT